MTWGEAQAIAKDNTRWRRTLLRPYAPLGVIRIDDDDDTLLRLNLLFIDDNESYPFITLIT